MLASHTPRRPGKNRIPETSYILKKRSRIKLSGDSWANRLKRTLRKDESPEPRAEKRGTDPQDVLGKDFGLTHKAYPC